MNRSTFSALFGLSFGLLAAFASPRVSAASDEATPGADDPVAIFGGETVPPCGWPSVASLGGCSTSLIHPEVLLLAAHCGDGYTSVWFGETAFNGTGREVAIDHCETNPAWTGQVGQGTDYAYCVLAEPVLDVPIIPVAAGCETTLLYPGRPVVQVGFGQTEDGPGGTKHVVVNQVNLVDHGEVGTGGNGLDICFGDSGGPTFIRLPDGPDGEATYRQVGIHSWTLGCGRGSWSTLAASALPWIEARTGIDVTPCHSAAGVWHPSPSCGVAPLDPETGLATDWSRGCGGGELAHASATCGPAFNPAEDLVGPAIDIVEPADRVRIDLPEGETKVRLAVIADATDEISGVAAVRLVINGDEIEHGRDGDPPWQWDAIVLSAGVWEIAAVAEDFAGNETLADAIVIGIDRDPPPAPIASGSSSTGDASDSGEGSESSSGGSTSTGSTGGSSSESSGAAVAEDHVNDGCSCTSTGSRSPVLVSWLSLALFVVRPRRRTPAHAGRLAAALGMLLGLSIVLAPTRAAAAVEATPGADEPAAIYGGEPVPPCGWPSVVSLEGSCSASLIHPEVVLYAAHCGVGYSTVWFGETAYEGEGREVAIDHCEVNPAFRSIATGTDYAYCVLAEPVLDVPIIPVAAGCETTLLYPGRPVVQVGFGWTDDEIYGTKHAVVTQVNLVEHGEVGTGGGGRDICNGDSGGPTFIRLPEAMGGDGTYRQVAIHSWGFGCGTASWNTLAWSALSWIEERTGIDVTPCHTTAGVWHPGPTCGSVPLDPESGLATDWSLGCGGGALALSSTTCGSAFDPTDDLAGPEIRIVEPADRARIDLPESETYARITVVASATDDISGVAAVRLVIDGLEVEHGRDHDPPWQWDPISLRAGVWEITAIAEDFAGNETVADTIVVGIDRDPPPVPAVASSTGDASGSDGSDGSGKGGPRAGEPASESGAAIPEVEVGDGCGCTGAGRRSPALVAWLLLASFAVRPRRRRERGRATGLAIVLGTAACGGDDAPPAASTESSSTGSGESTSTGAVSSESEASTSESSFGPESSSTTAAACPIGTEDCGCMPEFTCGVDLRCELDTCVACPFGSYGCPCRAEGETPCDEEALCFSGYCAIPPACPFAFDNRCDDAPNGLCSPGTDPDCCATRGNGVCEEMTRGGECLPGTDTFDCCATPGNGVCEEAQYGGTCPNGTDADDCCARPEDGVCDELSQGGACLDGSDTFDCCPTREDGVCEELSQGGVCPDGSDIVDCAPG